MPSFAVYHDVNRQTPSKEYIKALRQLTEDLTAVFPDVFRGTRYFFDPSETLRPCFIQIFKIESSHYLYLLRPDLDIKISESRIVKQGTNDTTAEYETNKLYFEALLIPVHQPDITATGGRIPIERFFSSTWIGETGKGYHINGQWIDREVTKLISASFLPENIRNYPYYPFQCDFNTVCFFPAALSPEGRKSQLGYFHKTLPALKPNIPDIENGLKAEEFSREHPVFLKLKQKIPAEWTKIWSSLKIKPYLNENEMKEFGLEFTF